MALLQEVWVQDIQERLTDTNAFILHSLDHSAFVHGALVHVPQAGAIPASQKNRTTLPGTVSQRSDADLTYPVYTRSTDPILVPDLENFQLSYDKRQSVMAAHLDRLIEDTGKDIAYEWAATASGKIIRTTGTASGNTLAPGATGTRKAITVQDVANLARQFDLDNVPGQDRFLMLHPALYYELFTTDALIRADVMGRPTLPQGAIASLFGFNIIVKATTPIYTTTGAPVRKDLAAAPDAADLLAAIAWQKNCVARAISGIEVFENAKDATYYGDVISARIFVGATKLRSTGVGTGAIVQG